MTYTVGVVDRTALLTFNENAQRINVYLTLQELRNLIHLLNSIEEILQVENSVPENIGGNLL